MPQQKFAPTWLNPFAGLIGRQRGAVPPAYRRLRGECLEDRMVLSTAALPVDTAQGQSLADYLAQAHSMGPALPAEPAAAPASDVQQLSATLSPTSIDRLFGVEHGEGEGGSGWGSGSGSGSGSGAGSGSGSGAGSGSGSGSGSGAGSGSGGGSGSGSSGDPGITGTDVTNTGDNITVTGYVTDDGGLDGLTMTLDGATGSVTIGDDGSFTINITDTDGSGTFTISVTDSNGNSTTYTFSY